MSKKEKVNPLQASVDDFNKHCKIGNMVKVKTESGEFALVSTETKASLVNGRAVVSCKGHEKAFDLVNVRLTR